ncbi:DUF4176 domain-containing protein [Carnobacterium divergens]|uniref:DUF4176 domain-containing protein n=1 Tax=Carnobacterium divergens TaxID=2748 RepID=UPI0028926805|nr:DUF4176 domain-containing protein [Carnobacterium divergens]MDT2011671.1 DUF4176 domain-containing protein [Carnobacterium divergens]
MEKTNMLPLGSVVYLQEGVIPLMIVSRQPLLNLNNEVYYLDYAAVNQITGLTNTEEIAYFNNEDISSVLSEGFVGDNEERVLFALQEWREKNKDIPKGKVIELNKDKKNDKNSDNNDLDNEDYGF